MPKFTYSGFVYTGNSVNGRDYIYTDERIEALTALGIECSDEEAKGFEKFARLENELARNQMDGDGKGILVNGLHFASRGRRYDKNDFGYKFETTYTVVKPRKARTGMKSYSMK